MTNKNKKETEFTRLDLICRYALTGAFLSIFIIGIIEVITNYFNIDLSDKLGTPTGLVIIMFCTLMFGLLTKAWVESGIENTREYESRATKYNDSPELYMLWPIKSLCVATGNFLAILAFIFMCGSFPLADYLEGLMHPVALKVVLQAPGLIAFFSAIKLWIEAGDLGQRIDHLKEVSQ